MADLILTNQESGDFNQDPLNLSDDAIGKMVINAGIIICETEDTVNPNKGVEKAGGVLGGIICDVNEGKPLAFNMILINNQGVPTKYCIAIEQKQYDDDDTKFSAVIDGKRINTDDGDELADRIYDAETVTELTFTFGKNK